MGKYRDARREWNLKMRQVSDLAIKAREISVEFINGVRELNAMSVRMENIRDEFWNEVLDEVESESGGKKVTIKEIRIDDNDVPAPEPATPIEKYNTPTKRTDTTKPNVTAEPKFKALPTPAPPGKRACSVCRSLEPYPHRAKNCPNAHLIKAVERAAASLPKRRKK